MLTKIGDWFLSRTTKDRVITIVIALAGMLFNFLTANNKWVSFLFGIILVIEIGLIIVIVSATVSVMLENKEDEAEQKAALERLKAELSYDDFKEVRFIPKNSDSLNIQRCMEIFEDFEVTHFARLCGDDNVIVIAKDASGRDSIPNTMTPQFFEANYKVL